MSFEDETLDETTEEATEQTARSAFQVLKSLADDPFTQVVKFKKYEASVKNRLERLKACLSEEAVQLLNTYRPKA
jgi:hypothetical protein